MRSWLLLLGGLLIWAAHFFALYGVASLFPGRDLARYLGLALTALASGACAWLLVRVLGRPFFPAADELANLIRRLAATGAGLALIAILYQALPLLA